MAREQVGTEGRAARLEIWALVCFHGALPFLSALALLFTLYLGQSAGWLPAPATPDDHVVQSPLGYAIFASQFLLGAATLLAIAWRLRRIADQPEGSHPT